MESEFLYSARIIPPFFTDKRRAHTLSHRLFNWIRFLSPDPDSNQDNQNQNLRYYHYTIGL